MVKAQEWLDQNYPKAERSKVREIYLNEPSLSGELDLGDFTHYNSVKVLISPEVDEYKLTFINKPKKVEIIPVTAQRYLNYYYPQEQRSEEKILVINSKKIEGKLNLSDFTSLERLDCSRNELTILEVSNCSNLEELYCEHNKLTKLILPNNLEGLYCSNNLLIDLDFKALNSEKLTRLDLSNNNFSTKDLSCFARFTELEELRIGTYYRERVNQNLYNRWISSLEHLKDLNKLKYLSIENTDLNERIEYLPTSLKQIKYSTNLRPNCKLISLIPWLDKYSKFGRCLKCRLINTSKNWCQPCSEQEWSQDLKQLTGQKLIEKFIEQQGKDYEGKPNLPWIPYEQFTDIEYLAEGGFSKIYRVKWYGADKEWKRQVVLKSLNNSSNITLEFLAEIANNKLVDEYKNIVQCYGISQDPITKNYVIVMKYMKDGNLREYLKNNYSKLSWEDKLWKLRDITNGLSVIHYQNLVHRDFHSGNILKGNESYGNYSKICITDLGLSRPVNSRSQRNEIFGVLSYIAPEVLQGKPYTQASDVYSFGIIIAEMLTGLPPYYDKKHDVHLALKICQGERPKFQIKIPPLLDDFIKRCWDADPVKRPNIKELRETSDNLRNWHNEIKNKEDTLFTQQIKLIEEYDQSLPEQIRFPKYEIHLGASYRSKSINTKQITELLQQGSRDLELDINEFDLVELAIQEKNQNQNWTNINPNFTEELSQSWTNLNFTYSQTQEWIAIGLRPTEADYAHWLKEEIKMTPEQVLNSGNNRELRELFAEYQYQAQIEITPKSNN